MAAAGPAAISLRLRELAGHLRLRGEDRYRARAYQTAADAVEALGDRFAGLLVEGRLTEVPGIGDKLASTITELARTGTTATLERYRAEIPTGLLLLAELPGLTLPRVRLLHAQLGIDGIEALEAAARAGRLQTVKGFGPRSESKLLEAIARRREERPAQLIHRHAQLAAHPLLLHLREAPGVHTAAVAGSIRRWKEVVSTVRLVAAADDPPAAIAGFLHTAPVGEIVARDPGRTRFRLLGGGVGEVVVVPPRRWGTALLQQTGSQAYVQALAALAAERGQALDGIEADSEAEVYARLGLPELPPELREAEAADDWAGGGAGLIEIGDVRASCTATPPPPTGVTTCARWPRARASAGWRT
jgi:DNA polymerase (family 10)